jgi:hypothetical protein
VGAVSRRSTDARAAPIHLGANGTSRSTHPPGHSKELHLLQGGTCGGWGRAADGPVGGDGAAPGRPDAAAPWGVREVQGLSSGGGEPAVAGQGARLAAADLCAAELRAAGGAANSASVAAAPAGDRAAREAAAALCAAGARGRASAGDPQAAMMPELPAVAAAARGAAAREGRQQQLAADRAPAGDAAGGGAAGAQAGSSGGGSAAREEGAPDDSRQVFEYEIEVLAVIPGRGRLSGKPVLSEAARRLPAFDLGAAALVNRRLRPRRRHHAPRRWAERHLSVNVRAPFGCLKGLLRCLGVRG